MDIRYYMIIIKGEIKTTEVMSCVYDTNVHKWNVKFNNGKSYLYAYMNVEKLTKPDVLNPKSYRISREGREFFDIDAISVFRGDRSLIGIFVLKTAVNGITMSAIYILRSRA